MARNSVQFQKGLSEAGFEALYGTEEKCRAVLFAWRWPEGFVCPECGRREHCLVRTRALFQCTACRRQTSPTAGTIFAATKVPLRTWFRAMYHVTQSKQGISSIEPAAVSACARAPPRINDQGCDVRSAPRPTASERSAAVSWAWHAPCGSPSRPRRSLPATGSGR